MADDYCCEKVVKMRYIENIVIGYPIYPLKELISDGTDVDYSLEYNKTHFTHKRNLAAILKDIGVVQSVNEVRRNKPEYRKELTDLDCFWAKWGKRKFYVIVGRSYYTGSYFDMFNNEKASDTWTSLSFMRIGYNPIRFKEETEHGD